MDVNKQIKLTHNDKMVAILRRLKPEMHGAVVEAMESRGIKYGLNYGVAVPVIRQVAREYAPDPGLAAYLFRQDVRELKLAAIYIDDPKELSGHRMEAWASAMPADEIMEHAAMNLFYAAPDAGQVIPKWLKGDDRMHWKGALHMIGRAGVKGILDASTASRYLDNTEEFLAEKKNIPVRAAVYALCGLARSCDSLSSKILELTGEKFPDAPPEVREILEETAALLS